MIAYDSPDFNFNRHPTDAGALGLCQTLSELPTSDLITQGGALRGVRGSGLWPLAVTRYWLIVGILAERMVLR